MRIETVISGFIIMIIIISSILPSSNQGKITIEITDVEVSNISSSYAVVSFFTSIPAVGVVKYGTSPDNLNMTAEDRSMRSTGLIYIPLYDLKNDTTYYFSVLAYTNDSYAFDDNHGSLYKFRTSGFSYTTPHVITGSVARIDDSGNIIVVEDALVKLVVIHRGSKTLPQTNVSSRHFGTFVFNTGNLKLPSGLGYDIQYGDIISVEVNAGPYGTGKNTTVYDGGDVDMGVIFVSPQKEPEEQGGITSKKKPEIIVSPNTILILIIALITVVLLAKLYSMKSNRISKLKGGDLKKDNKR